MTSKLIPVKQGEAVSFDSYGYAPNLAKRNLAPQLTTALVGGTVAGIALGKSQPMTPDQSRQMQSLPVVGFSAALTIPLVKSLVERQLPDAGVEMAFYDKQGRFLYRHRTELTKIARTDWQHLVINGQADRDGFVTLRLRNESKMPVWFDKLSFQKATYPSVLIAKNLASHTLRSRHGFANQVTPKEDAIYQTSSFGDCEEGGGDDDFPVTDGEWLNVDVTVTAPRYVYDSGNIVPIGPEGSTNTGGSGSAGTIVGTITIKTGTFKNTKLGPFIGEIEIDLTDPCLKAVTDFLFSIGGGTEIVGEKVGQILAELAPTSTKKKIFLGQEANSDRSLDGSYTPTSGNGDLKLNTVALENASEPYIAATLIHELVHGYYHEINNKPLGNDADHVNMAGEYVEPMAQALVGLYGMPVQDAIDLAWGGLGDTPQFLALSPTERNRISLTNESYKNGTKGKKDCRK